MKERFQQWLDQRARTPGVLSCGVRWPDQTTLNASNAQAFPADRLSLAWHLLAETAQGLLQHRTPVTRMLWTFEEAQLHSVIRADGISLGLFTPATAGAFRPEVIEAVIAEFLAL